MAPVAVRRLETHLFDGNQAFMGGGAEFLLVYAPGTRQPDTTKTGAVLAVKLEWRAFPILADPINRTNRIFLSRVPYRRQSMFTCNAFTLLHPNVS